MTSGLWWLLLLCGGIAYLGMVLLSGGRWLWPLDLLPTISLIVQGRVPLQ